jgi:FixJ family two-component response regulator
LYLHSSFSRHEILFLGQYVSPYITGLYEIIIAFLEGGGRFVSDMSSVNRANLVAVVDDDDLLRDALRRLLKSSGLGAISFESAEDLLNSGRLSEIACLIADVRMPGISGLELQARLKTERCEIPVIFITAHGDAKMRIQAMRDGAVEFLTKPFDNAVLIEMVRAAIKVNSGRFLGANR